MLKKILMYFAGTNLLLILAICNVQAEVIIYTNDNNVSMTQEQYDYFTQMFWDGYQQYVTLEQFNHALDNGRFDSTIERVEYDTDDNKIIQDRATVHETTAKRLSISKACGSSSCTIVTTLQWKGTPNVKSYDVMGARMFNGTTLSGTPVTTLYYSGGTNLISDLKIQSQGFGSSMKLPNSTTNIKVSQYFDVTGTGKVYASYQHATQTISYANSRSYDILLGGYGGVFSFYGNAVGVYDGMGGVYVTIS